MAERGRSGKEAPTQPYKRVDRLISDFFLQNGRLTLEQRAEARKLIEEVEKEG